MHSSRRLRVVIEVDHGEPIHGYIQARGEIAQPFRGWLELSHELERLKRESETLRGVDAARR